MKPVEVLEMLRRRVADDDHWADEAARGGVLAGIRLSIQTVTEHEARVAHYNAMFGVNKAEAAEVVPQSPIGVDIIGSMSRQQLIQEIAHNQLIQLSEVPHEGLVQMVIQTRLASYRDRLVKESGLDGLG